MKNIFTFLILICFIASAFFVNAWGVDDQKMVSKNADKTMFSKIYTLENADAGVVCEVVKKVISPNGGISYDSKTNSIIVCDSQEYLDRLNEIIPSLDIKSRDVMIELRVMETSNSFLEKIGFDIRNSKNGFAKYKGSFGVVVSAMDSTSSTALGLADGIIPLEDRRAVLDKLENSKDTILYSFSKLVVKYNRTGYFNLGSNEIYSSSLYIPGRNSQIATSMEYKRMLGGRILKIRPRAMTENRVCYDVSTEIDNQQRGFYYSGQDDPFLKVNLSDLSVNDGDSAVFCVSLSPKKKLQKNFGDRMLVIFITTSVL